MVFVDFSKLDIHELDICFLVYQSYQYQRIECTISEVFSFEYEIYENDVQILKLRENNATHRIKHVK